MRPKLSPRRDQHQRVQNPYAVLAAAVAGRTARPPSRPVRPPWRGDCDERMQMLGFDGDAPTLCPQCEPSRQSAPGSSLPADSAPASQALLSAAEGERLYPYIVVSLLSGIRTDEVRALRREHVRLDGKPETVSHIDVWRSVRAGGDTKTPKSRRSLQLPQVAVQALRIQQKEQEKDRLIAGDCWREHGVVFGSIVGTAPAHDRQSRKHYRSAGRREVCWPAEDARRDV